MKSSRPGACETDHCVKEVEVKPGLLSSISGTHVVEVENQLMKVATSDPHTSARTRVHTHISYTHAQINNGGGEEF